LVLQQKEAKTGDDPRILNGNFCLPYEACWETKISFFWATW